jgi:hypothetical protein
LGVILGSGVGLSERALSTRLKVTADDIMRDVSSRACSGPIESLDFPRACG